MSAESPTKHPLRPDSVADWEDLLVRLEIVPRVARGAVEEVRDVAAATAALGDAISHERMVARLLEEAAGIGGGSAANDTSEDDPLARVRRFASLRARTFAMVQRRGLEVWDWRVSGWDGGVDGSATVYQLLRSLADRDAALLARLRSATARSPARC